MHVEPGRLDSDRYPLKQRILARYADRDPLWRYGMAMLQDGASAAP